MKTGALQLKKNRCSSEPLPARLLYAQAIEDLQHCLSDGYSKVKETYWCITLSLSPVGSSLVVLCGSATASCRGSNNLRSLQHDFRDLRDLRQ